MACGRTPPGSQLHSLRVPSLPDAASNEPASGMHHLLLQATGRRRTPGERQPRRTRAAIPSKGSAGPPVLPQPTDFAWGPAEETAAACFVMFTVAVDELANASTTWMTSVTPPSEPA